MSRTMKVLFAALGIFSLVASYSIGKEVGKEVGNYDGMKFVVDNYMITPADTRFIMWVEECPLCGGDLECEYSYPVEMGYKNCKTCWGGYSFTDVKEVLGME